MDIKKILKAVDHTLLSQTATWSEIKEVLDDAIKYKVASVCIPPSYVKASADYLCGKIPVCTVIGFPNGYSTTATKCFEALEAVKLGASEIDMVINLGWAKDGLYEDILNEINAVKKACDGRILKVIIETSLLTNEEKIRLCEIVSRSDAEFIKTSTGFGGGGATLEDIKLFKENVSPNLKIKASGGIASLSDGEKFLELGCSRLGTSRIVKAVKNM